MPARFFVHSTLLFAAALGVYLWLSSPLEPYTLQLSAVLSLAYLLVHKLKKTHKSLTNKTTINIDITILTSMILLLVTETGSLTSPLFFLLYFLLFAVSMLYEIEATLILTATLILYFLISPTTNLTDLAHLSELLGLIMVTPLAIFTAHQYESTLEQKALRHKLDKHLSHQETDTLLFLSLNLKSTLVTALDNLSSMIPSARANELRLNLQTLYSDLRALYKTSLDLERAIDQETDEPKP